MSQSLDQNFLMINDKNGECIEEKTGRTCGLKLKKEVDEGNITVGKVIVDDFQKLKGNDKKGKVKRTSIDCEWSILNDSLYWSLLKTEVITESGSSKEPLSWMRLWITEK